MNRRKARTTYLHKPLQQDVFLKATEVDQMLGNIPRSSHRRCFLHNHISTSNIQQSVTEANDYWSIAINLTMVS